MKLETQVFPAPADYEDELKLTVCILKKDMADLFRYTCYIALEKIRTITEKIELNDTERMNQITDIQLESEHEDWDLPPLGANIKIQSIGTNLVIAGSEVLLERCTGIAVSHPPRNRVVTKLATS